MASPGEKKGEEGHGGYLVTDEKGNCHLPTRRNGKLDHGLLGMAHAALFSPSGYRGKPYDGPGKEEAKTKLRALYKEAGLEWPSETSSECPSISLDGFFPMLLSAATLRMPLIVTGSWVRGKKFSFSLDDLKNIVRNFRKRKNGELNVDYDHASEMPEIAGGGPVPSSGRLLAISDPEPFRDNKGVDRHILWGTYEPTERARTMIANREYRRVSPAVDPNVKDKETGEPQGMTLTSMALTNKPYLEELPELRLSENGIELMDSSAVHIPGNISGPQSAGKGGKVKTYKVKKLADGEHKGKHGVFDGDTMMGLGEIEPDAQQASEARVAVLSEIAPGKTIAEAKVLVERGAAVNQESKLLSEIVSDKGKIDTVKLDDLTDSGRVKPSATRRAMEAESKSQAAFAAGKIKAADLQAATRLALSDADAFERFVAGANAQVDLTEHGCSGEGGAGAANVAWSQALEKKAATLLNEKRATNPEDALRLAERELINTNDGLRLYELARKERLEEAERESK